MELIIKKAEAIKIVTVHVSSMFPGKVVKGECKYDGEFNFDITDSEEKKAE